MRGSWALCSSFAAVLLGSIILGSGVARAIPIDLNDFFADPTVTVSLDGTSALLAEDAALSPVLLSNNPGLGDPNVIIPGTGLTLFFDFVFTEAAGEDDEFGVFLLDAATGLSVGSAFEFFAQSSAAATIGFDLSSLASLTLGLQFQMSALPGDGGLDSTLTISNATIVGAALGVAEPGSLASLIFGLVLLAMAGSWARRRGELGG